jgi:hypothetical protein
VSDYTEQGRPIEGLIFVNEPWVYWRSGNGHAYCERCQTIVEIHEQNPVVESPCAKLALFWNQHRMCTPDGPTPEQRNKVNKPGKRRKKDQEVGPIYPTIVFPPGNNIAYCQLIATSNGTDEVPGTGIPPGILFELHGADKDGVWLYGPNYGGKPKGNGPLRIHWHRDFPNPA